MSVSTKNNNNNNTVWNDAHWKKYIEVNEEGQGFLSKFCYSWVTESVTLGSLKQQR